MKTQMKYQKILTLVCLIFAALCIVFSFFFVSGMTLEIRYYATIQYNVTGANELNSFVQSANNTLVIMSIVLLLSVVIIYLTQTNKRRNYYITNYIAIGLLVGISLACSIVFLVVMAKTLTLCSQVDTEKWYELYMELNRRGGWANPRHYSLDKTTVILGIVIAVLMLVMIAAWVLNTLWKVKLMKGEKALLRNSEVKEAV